jgi:hypothetical protein
MVRKHAARRLHFVHGIRLFPDTFHTLQEVFMKKIYLPAVLLAGFFITGGLHSDVPPVHFRKPDVPGFLQSMDFQTVQMQVFPREITGMVPDPFSDLSWNPAYVMQASQKSVYLDFHSMNQVPLFAAQGSAIAFGSSRGGAEDPVSPRWYPQTTVQSVQTIPLYNFGILLPLNPKLSVGFFNRTVFDYGPFLQGVGSAAPGGGWGYDEARNGGNLVPQRLETANNQQTVLGNQLEAVIGYKISEKLDLGLRFGHMVFDRHGDLLEDSWAKYPHSSNANLQDESRKIRGHHVEAGLGLLFRPDSTLRIGVYGGVATGNGSERSASLDTSRNWSERDVDPRYYGKDFYFLNSNQTFHEDGSRPQAALTFEKQLSDKWIIRSAFSAAWSDVNVSGELAAGDTLAGDQTYDYYESSNNTYLRRWQYHGSRDSGLSGNGIEKTRQWEAFASAAYAPGGAWSLFGGIHLQHYTSRRDFNETARFRSSRWDGYSVYKPETTGDASANEREYSLKTEYDRWSLLLPIGFRIRVVRGLSVLLGSGVAFSLEDEKSEGERLYPFITTSKWANEKLIVDDRETDRYEVFSSEPAKVLSRQWGRYFGLAYEHPSGAKVYLRFTDDFSQMNNWAFGFALDW